MSIKCKEPIFQPGLEILTALCHEKVIFPPNQFSSPVHDMASPAFVQGPPPSLSHLGKKMVRLAAWPNHCLATLPNRNQAEVTQLI